MEDFKVAGRPTADWAVLDLSGEIDINSAPRLKEAIVASISAGKTKVALNMAGVDFMDSTGLAALVAGAKRTREANGDLALVQPNEQIRRILSITELIKVLPVHESLEELTGAQFATRGS